MHEKHKLFLYIFLHLTMDLFNCNGKPMYINTHLIFLFVRVDVRAWVSISLESW
jgi:hypothetical protein